MPASEFSLIYRYFSHLGGGDAVDLSVGDDCAILRLGEGERLATSVDTMVSGVHFPEDSFPRISAFAPSLSRPATLPRWAPGRWP